MSTLIDFLRQQRKVRDPKLRESQQREWLDALKALFRQIRSWLAEAEQEKLVKVTLGEIKLTEEALRSYSAPCLTLRVGAKTVSLRPIGSYVIGADGRVDMESPGGKYIFLYLADQKKWVYGFGGQPNQFAELTEDVFTNLLQRALA